jgi:hypothetical protein
MRLKVGQSYRVYLSDGERRDWTVIHLKVLGDEGGGWYKVDSGGQVFFLNLNQALRVYEN